MTKQDHIRNFCIIAHIDHGKSTLADRILEITGVKDRENSASQVLDGMDLEKERGITIKMTAVTMNYTARDGQAYTLNLIDTPGHVDFSYEVSRSLAACEGAVLVVDTTQGVQAQTLANTNLAMNSDLEIIPVLNKIDMAAADPDKTREEIENVLMIDASEAIPISARSGQGVEEVLEAIVGKVPPPSGDPGSPLKALIFDSHFDQYLGIVAYVRVMDGVLKNGSRIRMMSSGKEFEVTGTGVFTPRMTPGESLSAGEVGYFTASMKNVGDTRVGDTVTLADRPAAAPLKGYKEARPMVFSGLYPIETKDFNNMREALARLQLNDASFTFEQESSAALGTGFRCGFLGLLHMDIVQERLEREFGLNLIATAPSVIYRVVTVRDETLLVENPSDLPEPERIRYIEEPWVSVSVMVPSAHIGPVIELCRERRGEYNDMEYPARDSVIIKFDMPLAEIVMDFFDTLKSVTHGYATLDYEFKEYRKGNVEKLVILLNYEPVDALSFITHRERAAARARVLVDRLKEVIPRQQFEIRIQAQSGNNIIAASTVKPFRKNVIAKCYGGDITRKRKLLEKQKEGKKRMKTIGSVEVPQEAFMSVLRIGSDAKNK
ncbi:MAG: translation elongation factor 4 [Abditibacteriota bacterium]|nr:translation elongation factor 4 [Abditibacteriota bacterium]